MAKVVTMGEIMLRLSSAGNSRFVQCESFDVCYGGGEANVAVSLANYGMDAAFLSFLRERALFLSGIFTTLSRLFSEGRNIS